MFNKKIAWMFHFACGDTILTFIGFHFWKLCHMAIWYLSQYQPFDFYFLIFLVFNHHHSQIWKISTNEWSWRSRERSRYTLMSRSSRVNSNGFYSQCCLFLFFFHSSIIFKLFFSILKWKVLPYLMYHLLRNYNLYY